MKTSWLREENIYSAVLIGDQASGTAKFLSAGQGSPIVSLGKIARAKIHQQVHTELTTNISKAGDCGTAIGKVTLLGVRFNLEEIPLKDRTSVTDNCLFELRVGGRLVFNLCVSKLLDGKKFFVPIGVERQDCVDPSIQFHKKVKLKNPILIWCTLYCLVEESQ